MVTVVTVLLVWVTVVSVAVDPVVVVTVVTVVGAHTRLSLFWYDISPFSILMTSSHTQTHTHTPKKN